MEEDLNLIILLEGSEDGASAENTKVKKTVSWISIVILDLPGRDNTSLHRKHFHLMHKQIICVL